MGWSIPRALMTTWTVLLDNFAAFYGVALLLTSPVLLFDLAGISAGTGLFVSIACNVAVTLCLNVGTLQAMAGGRPTFMELLRHTGRRDAGGLLMLGIVETVVIGTGILLVVPGLWILSLWAVAMPAMIVEGTRLGASFKRSMELTKGARWRILGTYLSWVMLLLVFLLLAATVMHLAFGLAARGTTGSLVAGWIAGTVLVVVLACLPAVLYVLLRVEKEATTPEEIAAALGERPG